MLQEIQATLEIHNLCLWPKMIPAPRSPRSPQEKSAVTQTPRFLLVSSQIGELWATVGIPLSQTSWPLSTAPASLQLWTAPTFNPQHPYPSTVRLLHPLSRRPTPSHWQSRSFVRLTLTPLRTTLPLFLHNPRESGGQLPQARTPHPQVDNQPKCSGGYPPSLYPRPAQEHPPPSPVPNTSIVRSSLDPPLQAK